MRHALLALIVAALLAGAGSAMAAPGDDIGATVRIVNLVTGEYEKDRRDLAKGDPVRQDELIEVSDDGIGEIRLNDDTELALGPGARLKLDEFVYNPDIDGGAIIVNLVRGAFRFITGIAAKPAYVIKTPTASITVRGTTFDVYVLDNDEAWLLLVEGAIQACNELNNCGVLDEPGKLIRITPDGVIGDPLPWAELATDDLPFATAFPFIVTPPTVDPDPVLTPEDVVGAGPDSEPEGPGVEEDDDEISDDIVDDGPGPAPALHCWSGWKRVHRGWRRNGWGVKRRRRGDRSIWCAIRIDEPGYDIQLPPKCIGGRTVLRKTLPPRWRCVCPDGKKRRRIGHRAFICKGRPGDGGPGLSPKEKCLKRGWKWVGGICIPRIRECKRGYVGKWPNCKKIIVEPPKKCPKGFYGKPPHCQPKKCKRGYTGKWPDCKKIGHPKKCPRGFVGKPPHCKKIGKPKKRCKRGYVGKWPNCKKLGIKPIKKCKRGYVGKWPNCKKVQLKPKKTIKDFKKAFDKFKKQN